MSSRHDYQSPWSMGGMYGKSPQVSTQYSDILKLTTTSLQTLANIDALIINRDYNNNTIVRSTLLLHSPNVMTKQKLIVS